MFEKNSVSKAILGIVIVIIISCIVPFSINNILLRFNITEEFRKSILVFLSLMIVFSIILPIILKTAIDLDELDKQNDNKNIEEYIKLLDSEFKKWNLNRKTK